MLIRRHNPLLVGALIGTTALSCCLAAPALAQDGGVAIDEGEEVISVSVTGEAASPVKTPFGQADGIAPVIKSEGACAPGAISRPTEASSLGCAFEDTTLGFTARQSVNLADALIGIELQVGRGTSGGLSLDHTMRGFRRGLNSEATLTNIAVDGKFLDGRVEWKSGFSWTREWQAPIAQSSIQPLRIDETSGSASTHSVKIKLIDQPSFKWSLEGETTQATDSYRPFYVSLPERLFAAEGSMARANTRLQLAGWNLRAAYSSIDNRYIANERRSLSVSRSGVTVRWQDRQGQTKAGSEIFTDRQTRTLEQSFGLDLDAFGLVPMIAMEDAGLASLVPKTISFEIGKRDTFRTSFGQRGLIESNYLSAFGLWTTPLGDTILNFRIDSEEGHTPLGKAHKGSESFFMISHGFQIGNWSLDLDYVTSSDARGDALVARDGSAIASFGVGVRYASKGKPSIDFEIGSDNFDVTLSDGGFRLRDRSLRAEMEVNFTPWLQQVTQRDDMRLRFDLRWDFENSGYEFTVFDEIIDRSFESQQNRGALLTFVMDLK